MPKWGSLGSVVKALGGVAAVAALMSCGKNGCRKEPAVVDDRVHGVKLNELPKPAVQPPTEQALAAENRFREKHAAAGISWDLRTGFARSVTAFYTDPSGEAPGETAQKFIEENRALFVDSKNATQFSVASVSKPSGQGLKLVFVKLHQRAGEHPVFEGEIVVRLTWPEKRVIGVTSAARSVLGDVQAPKVDQKTAIAKVNAKLPKDAERFRRRGARLVVIPDGARSFLAWEVLVGPWQGIVHGQNGEVIFLRDRTYHATARVFLENQGVNASTSDRTIQNLVTDATTLSGTRFAITNGAGDPATSATQEFLAGTGSPQFDDQMAYYHLEKTLNLMTKFGLAPPGAPVSATTLMRGYECNASYVPWEDVFEFGTVGSGCTADSTHYGDIIAHEYIHRMLTTDFGLVSAGLEAGGIHEGIADYFSVASYGNPCMAEGFFGGGTACMRDLSVDKRYPQDMANDDFPGGESHMAGEVMGSAAFTLRENIGASTADRIVYEGLKGLTIDSTFSEFAAEMAENGAAYFLTRLTGNPFIDIFVIAAAAGVGGSVEDAFCSHGITVPYGSFVTRVIRTPLESQSVDHTITVPAGFVVDRDRGCQNGFDRSALSWFAQKLFDDNRSRLTGFSETLGTNNLRVRMTMPDQGCGGDDVPQVDLIYRVYMKRAP